MILRNVRNRYLNRHIFRFSIISVFILGVLNPNQAYVQEAETKTWHEASHLSLEIDSLLDNSARFYLSKDRAFLLVLSNAFKDALVMNVREKVIYAFSKAEVRFEDSGSTAVTNEKIDVQSLGNYTQNKSNVSASLFGKEIRVVPRAHLIGQATLDELFLHTPAYRLLADQYKPNLEAVKFLSQYQEPVNFIVAFGTWCSHCKEWVPRLIKSVLDCNNPNLNCSFVGINRKFDQPKEFVENEKIKNIPTIIVHKNGKEIGRIVGTPKVSMEDDIAAILKGTYSNE